MHFNLVWHIRHEHPIKRVIVALNTLIQRVFHVMLRQLEESAELALLDDCALVVLVEFQMFLYDFVNFVWKCVHDFAHSFVNVVLLGIFKV